MPGNKSAKGMAPENATSLWRNARLATFNPSMEGIGAIENAAIAVRNGRIAFAGAESDLPADLASADETIDCGGRWITPALIDCHTHLVFGGNRAMEFEMRLNGATYEEIAKAGGGIVSSVRDTRALSEEALVAQALPRLDTLLAEGISTIEIKSGYGLDIETELKMLRVARKLETLRPVRIVTSYLAAHATPAEYKGRNADYMTDVVLPGLDEAQAEGLVDAVDGFCEGIAFSVEEMTRVFEKAKQLKLPVKLHAEQLSNLGGAELAASYGALSADHLEYLDEAGAKALGTAGTVAVLLPGAFYALREKQAPPVQLLRDAGADIALATDCNPGTSPLTSLLLTMNMGATLFRMTVEECLTATTRNAANALGLLAETGTLETGKSADFVIWDIERPAELVYRIGFNPLHARIFKGQKVYP
ncbi:imidazolonepropionase [Rhizobium oryzihabitans]|uniref:Imidazolonepropionase n=1 Tax=Rhizobium oryzihabitans TaxID=2267833 RepID=A0A7L5BNP7_9HYPH|nr:imidazolonepropionase [Rhizobium oryzihabitans]QCM07481.1 imidazolonepropionase [Agrobacterium tumefaciens]QIB40478.1 imidazolonepropionase [Rhizobium oryzihabitans]CUX57737.1 Imidazolonepropionase (Imidazolone-5-propionate hydrolase) [Agrobacterium genomosp. 5 str. CFBP 6626]